MKIGDLVMYKPYPHKELHESGLTGIVTDISPLPDQYNRPELDMVWVLWGRDRPQCPAGVIQEDYVDELEVLNLSQDNV